MKKLVVKIAVMLLIMTASIHFPGAANAATLILEGGMNEEIDMKETRVFTVPPTGLRKLIFKYANPATFRNPTISQSVVRRSVSYLPQPATVKDETDALGNVFTTVTWIEVNSDISVTETYTVKLDIELKDISSAAGFPLGAASIPPSDGVYLKSTPQTPADDDAIKRLSASLTSGAKTEHEAVTAVLNWVVDNIKYRTPIPEYGALWTLKTRTGNCQNFAHLSIALLRAAGIPARIVGGIALDKKWRVPMPGGALLQSIGQGGHAWMEVWYPDLGWVAYDPQQSHLFVSPRHIKQTSGLDSNDINDTWRAAPTLPPFSDDIKSDFIKDNISISLKKSFPTPSSYIMTNSMAKAARPTQPVIERPVSTPPVPAGATVEFGNLEFPESVNLYASGGNVGYKTFDRETSEYVTGDVTYAQAFTVDRPLRLDRVSLAMHRFGGRFGSLWIDVLIDKDGRPGMIEGFRSMPLALDSVRYSPGYKWFDFKFADTDVDKPMLKPGKYWIVLRRSKDAIVNWYFTPGNAYGGPDDARSTEKGIDWSNIMNLDFNFKVRGAYINDGK